MNRFKLAINAFWAIPAVFLMRLARRFLLVRICKIFSERIGHFTADVSEHIARKNFLTSKTLDIYYFGAISNQQWEIMARRSCLKVFGGWIGYIDRWNRLLPGGALHSLQSSQTQSRDIGGLFEKFEASIPFLEDENEFALSWLKSKGYKPGEPFICLLVRDSKFLEHFRKLSSNGNYHDYRDSDITSYAESAEWLAARGVWVIRMGKSMRNEFGAHSEKIIDYAFDADRSDLLDIWLFANCSGVISTATGPDQLAAIYGKPQLYVNALPLGKIHSWSNSIWVPKNLFWGGTNKRLTISEMLEHNYSQLGEYELAGIEIIDLNSHEILEAVKEFWQSINADWRPTSNQSFLQNYFWRTLREQPYFNDLHGVQHPKSRVGSSWLFNVSNNTIGKSIHETN